MANNVVVSVGLVVAAGALGFAGVKGYDFTKKKGEDDAFNKAVADARAAGLPIVHSDLEKMLAVDPKDDATELLHKLGRATVKVPLQDSQTKKDLSDDVVGASFEQETELIGLCAQATSGAYRPALGKFTTDMYQDFPSIKATVKRLTMAATWEARSGRWDVAKRNMDWATKFCTMGAQPPFRTLAQETTETKYFYYGAMLTILQEGKGSEASVSFVKNLLANPPKEPDLTKTWGGDLVMRVTEFEKPQPSRLQEEDPVDEEVWVYPPQDLWKRRAVLTDVIKSYMQINERVGKEKDIVAQLDAAKAVTDEQAKTFNPHIRGFLLTDELLKLLSDGIRTDVALQRIATVATYALEEKRLKGAYPANLDGSPYAGLKDPFGGQNLHYTATAGGFMVYTVGRNQRDDGGRGEPGWGLPTEPGNDDLGFRFSG